MCVCGYSADRQCEKWCAAAERLFFRVVAHARVASRRALCPSQKRNCQLRASRPPPAVRARSREPRRCVAPRRRRSAAPPRRCAMAARGGGGSPGPLSLTATLPRGLPVVAKWTGSTKYAAVVAVQADEPVTYTQAVKKWQAKARAHTRARARRCSCATLLGWRTRATAAPRPSARCALRARSRAPCVHAERPGGAAACHERAARRGAAFCEGPRAHTSRFSRRAVRVTPPCARRTLARACPRAPSSSNG
jgi:hypothetical protein